MFECKTFISVREIKEMLCVSESKAYSMARRLDRFWIKRVINL